MRTFRVLLAALSMSAAACAVEPTSAPDLPAASFGEGRDEAAAVQVGAVLTPDGYQPAAYEVIDGFAVVEGDMEFALDEIRDIDDPTVVYAATYLEPYRWPEGIIPYTIDSDVAEPDRIVDAIEHWEANTRIRLVPRTNQTDYVRFVDAESFRCTSRVGRVGGEQWIRAGEDCSVGNLIHEIGHAAGLYHEQSRSDRDEWVDIVWENIKDVDGDGSVQDEQSNFGYYNFGRDYGTYDYGSIMHYPPTAFGQGDTTIVALQPLNGATMGQRDGLSWRDRSAIEWFYSRDNTTIPTCRMPPTPSIRLMEAGYTSLRMQVDVAPHCQHLVDSISIRRAGTSTPFASANGDELPLIAAQDFLVPGAEYCYTAVARRGSWTRASAETCFRTKRMVVSWPAFSL